jgi:hypothetical protein
MNALGPPKAAGGSANAAHEIAELLGAYRALPAMQVPPWWLETERLAALYRQTHQARHLQALARHLDGVFARLISEGKP